MFNVYVPMVTAPRNFTEYRRVRITATARTGGMRGVGLWRGFDVAIGPFPRVALGTGRLVRIVRTNA
jgi:hypothetical protein